MYPLQKDVSKEIISLVGCNSLVRLPLFEMLYKQGSGETLFYDEDGNFVIIAQTPKERIQTWVRFWLLPLLPHYGTRPLQT